MINHVFFSDGQFESIRRRAQTDAHVRTLTELVLNDAKHTDDIGALAFADCPSLSYISVSEKNEAYRSLDGVLYTADLSVLILYPPRRVGESFTIHTATTVIREMAFFDCVYLKRIDYLGTPSQWERISIGSKNYTLLAIAKQFGA